MNALKQQKWHGCQECGRLFRNQRRSLGRRPNQFCSRRCAAAQRGRQRTKNAFEGKHSVVPWRECSVCSAAFISRIVRATCSAACAAERKRLEIKRYGDRKTRAAQEQAGVFACLECGSEFTRLDRPGAKAYCSDACSRRVGKRNANSRKRRRQRFREQRRKGDSIQLAKLIERDGGKCQLCGRKVTGGQWPGDRLAPTVDHIVPLAHGGTHTWNNVQLAHAECNFTRRDVGPAQMRMW